MSKQPSVEREISIPRYSRKKIFELSRRIRPLLYFRRKGLCYIKVDGDIFLADYMSVAKPAERAIGLRRFRYIMFFSTMLRGKTYFRPTVSEILAQIPDVYLEKVVAFEVMGQLTDDTDLVKRAYETGYRVGLVCLYTYE